MREIYSKKRLLSKTKNEEIYCAKGKLFIENKAERKIITLPNSGLGRILSRLRMFVRMLRMEPRFVVGIDKYKYLLSFKGAMYLLDTKQGRLEKELSYRTGMNNPLDVCVIEDENGGKSAYFGEYWGNEEKDSVAVYKRNITGQWSIVYEFSKNSITHIHQIQYDKYRDCIWILTGDSDSESGIWKADREFENVSPLVKGNQQYRACFIVPTENGLIYATDTPLEDNYIYYLNIDDKQCKILSELPGPCVYARMIGEKKFVCATSVEPDSSLSKWKYRLSNKRGKGVKTNHSYLLAGSEQGDIKILDSIQKDRYNMWLFQFGNFQFAYNECDDRIYCSATALRHYDGKTLAYDLGGNDNE